MSTLVAARLLTGMGLSAMTVIAITYLSETMPAEHRGRIQSAVLGIGLIGIPAVAFLARGVVPFGWRLVFLFGAIGILGLLVMRRLPESPRWLLDHGRAEQAETTLSSIEDEVRRATGERSGFTNATIALFGFLVGAFIQTFAALLHAYTPELYPTSIRNSGTGFAYGVGRLANLAGPFIVAALFGRLGYIWVFVYIAACWVLAALAMGIFGPSTTHRALEDLNATETAGSPSCRMATGR